MKNSVMLWEVSEEELLKSSLLFLKEVRRRHKRAKPFSRTFFLEMQLPGIVRDLSKELKLRVKK